MLLRHGELLCTIKYQTLLQLCSQLLTLALAINVKEPAAFVTCLGCGLSCLTLS